MLTAAENDLLCRVEGDAPMGQLMRRHWLPALLVEEVAAPDGDPVPVRLLGEDLVAFRDTEGRVGVMDRYCPHRRASLVFGRNEDCGLRCLYHGWKMDVAGNVVEMPSEVAGSGLAQKVRHRAYPVHEWGGFVWVYMGPPETMPPFEPPPYAPGPDAKLSIVKLVIDCNWAQVLEGAIDSAHSSSLHSSDMTPARVDGAKATSSAWLRPSTDKAPRLVAEPTNYGFKYAAVRRPIVNAAKNDYVRVTVFVAPIVVLIPPNNLYNVANINVPIDDTHTMFHFIAWNESGPPGVEQEAWRKFCGAQVGVGRRPRLAAHAHARQPLPAGPAGDAAGRLHRHPGHPQPGHRDVGDDGTHCRPHARPARRVRPGDRRVPPDHARGGAEVRRRRRRDRRPRPAHAPARVRGDRPEGHRLADAGRADGAGGGDGLNSHRRRRGAEEENSRRLLAKAAFAGHGLPPETQTGCAKPLSASLRLFVKSTFAHRPCPACR